MDENEADVQKTEASTVSADNDGCREDGIINTDAPAMEKVMFDPDLLGHIFQMGLQHDDPEKPEIPKGIVRLNRTCKSIHHSVLKCVLRQSIEHVKNTRFYGSVAYDAAAVKTVQSLLRARRQCGEARAARDAVAAAFHASEAELSASRHAVGQLEKSNARKRQREETQAKEIKRLKLELQKRVPNGSIIDRSKPNPASAPPARGSPCNVVKDVPPRPGSGGSVTVQCCVSKLSQSAHFSHYNPEDIKGSFKKTKAYCMVRLKERNCCGGGWHFLK
jgi:hypothetical protein